MNIKDFLRSKNVELKLNGDLILFQCPRCNRGDVAFHKNGTWQCGGCFETKGDHRNLGEILFDDPTEIDLGSSSYSRVPMGTVDANHAALMGNPDAIQALGQLSITHETAVAFRLGYQQEGSTPSTCSVPDLQGGALHQPIPLQARWDGASYPRN